MNPYDFSGPIFIATYVVFGVFAMFTSAILRNQLTKRGAVSTTSCHSIPLDGYELAILAGGRQNAFVSALSALEQEGSVEIYASTRKVKTTDKASASDPLECAILRHARTLTSVPELFRTVQPQLAEIEQKLVNYGLLLGAERLHTVRFASAAVALTPVIFLGIPKFFIGLERHRPVTLLVILSVLFLLYALKLATQKDKPTAAGEALVEKARNDNATLYVNYRSDPKTLSPKDLVLAGALFGMTGAVMATPYAQAHAALVPPRTYGSGGGSGCGSGSSCGGGSCGGGGCGGGCGGCGG